jgi:hypothetical protein
LSLLKTASLNSFLFIEISTKLLILKLTGVAEEHLARVDSPA